MTEEEIVILRTFEELREEERKREEEELRREAEEEERVSEKEEEERRREEQEEMCGAEEAHEQISQGLMFFHQSVRRLPKQAPVVDAQFRAAAPKGIEAGEQFPLMITMYAPDYK